MALDEVIGMNVAEVIKFYGYGGNKKDRTFFMYRDEDENIQAVSFKQFYDKSINYAALIQEIKREKGKTDADRFHIGFFMQNTPEVIYLLGGCAFTNSTLVGLNNAQIGEKLAVDINNMEIDVLFVDEVQQPKTGKTFLENVIVAQKKYGFSTLDQKYIIARKKQKNDHPGSISTIGERLEQHTGSDFTPVPLDSDSPGVIIFTSGTTGAPKGIEVPWKKLFDVGVVSTGMLKYTENDVGYICMPLNHSNSLYLNLMPALLNGAKVLIRRRFSSTNFVKDIEEVGATIWNSVGDPVMYVVNVLGNDVDYSHLPLRVVISTGTNIQNRNVFSKIFDIDSFIEAFGSTEVGAIAVVSPDTPRYCVGEYLPGKDIKILDEDKGLECELANINDKDQIMNFDRAVGEIVVSQKSLGASAFTGYYNLPQESAAKVDKNGYYHMGDLGAAVEIRGKRYLIFLGRTGTDRLRSKGENFSTTFVEDIIANFKKVLNGTVIGIPHVDSTENDNPVYIIEADNPDSFEIDEFFKFCKTELPDYALPGYIRVLNKLPMTDTEKIRKSALLHDFIERTPERDRDRNDILYKIDQGHIRQFRTGDYVEEIKKCADPAIQARFKAVTRRQDLF